MRPLTRDDIASIIDDANNGATVRDLADLHDLTEIEVEDLCKKEPEIGRVVRAAKARIRMFVRRRLMEVAINDADQRSAYCALSQLAKVYLREEGKKTGRPKKGEDIDLDLLSDEEVEKLLAESDSKFAEYVRKERSK